MSVTRQTLGSNYLTATGIVLAALFVPTLTRPGVPRSGLMLGILGIFGAISLTGAGVWLGACRLHGEGIWRVATHAGAGIGVVTLVNLFVLQFGPPSPPGSAETVALASSIAIGGAAGTGLGIAREFDRETRTLTQSTEVLSRALRHNLRNDITVILGRLDELESEVSGPGAESVGSIRNKVDDLATLSERAQQIEIAVTGRSRQRHPIDAVDAVERRVRATRATHPGVHIETDLPEVAWVDADWMLETAIENVLRTAIANGGSETVLKVGIERRNPGLTAVRIVDVDGYLPDAEIEALNSGTETPLEHGEGLGLWLANWIVKGFRGSLELDRTEEVRVVTLRLCRAVPTRGQRERGQ